MNGNSHLRKHNHPTALAAAALALCVLLSAAVLVERLAAFAAAEPRLHIPLTRSGGLTTVTVGTLDDAGDFSARDTRYHPANHTLLTVTPGFQATDERTVWASHTPVEIFRVSYENGAGQVTVNSQNGDKLLAPGTSNTYAFALENTGNVNLQYTMEMEAYFSNEAYAIPVRARVTDWQGNILAGTADAMAEVTQLNQVSDAGAIRAGYIMPYTLEWEWPFEEDDGYDTMLGNLAVGEDLTLTVVIRIMASYTPGPGDGIPDTGDHSDLALMTALLLLSCAGLLALLASRRKWVDGDA